ncbi:unnamed protein product [Sphagnum tenellum]
MAVHHRLTIEAHRSLQRAIVSWRSGQKCGPASAASPAAATGEREKLWRSSFQILRAELVAMAPRNGTTVVLMQQQLDIFAWNRKLARFFKAGQHQKAVELY